MLVNYLLLDSNNIVFEAPLFDTEINNGEVPDFILNRPDVVRIITDYRGTVYLGYPWDDDTQSIIGPPEVTSYISSSNTSNTSGEPSVVVD